MRLRNVMQRSTSAPSPTTITRHLIPVFSLRLSPLTGVTFVSTITQVCWRVIRSWMEDGYTGLASWQWASKAFIIALPDKTAPIYSLWMVTSHVVQHSVGQSYVAPGATAGCYGADLVNLNCKLLVWCRLKRFFHENKSSYLDLSFRSSRSLLRWLLISLHQLLDW